MLHKPGAFAIPSNNAVTSLSPAATLARGVLLAPLVAFWIIPLCGLVAATAIQQGVAKLSTKVTGAA